MIIMMTIININYYCEEDEETGANCEIKNCIDDEEQQVEGDLERRRRDR